MTRDYTSLLSKVQSKAGSMSSVPSLVEKNAAENQDYEEILDQVVAGLLHHFDRHTI